MAKITRIKASDGPRTQEPSEAESPILRKKVVVKDKKTDKNKVKEDRKAKKAAKKAEKKAKKNNGKKVFILFRPFVAFGRYLRDSWREIRQVRWPNRKATWKMLFAVIIYTALFVVIISLLDLLFGLIFKLILGN